MTPPVSIIIPCRDEEKYIGACLDSIVGCDYPKENLQVLVVDGMSQDGLRNTVKDYASKHSYIRLLDNPRKITPVALNVGIAHAEGDVIVRMDAHCTYPPDYVSKLVDWLDRSGADNVGGVWHTRPGAEGPLARAIAIALSHPFGVGNSYFRIGASQPRWVDTVPFGCYRRDVFDRIGLFDEELVRNQDDEFNLRLIKQGGRILLVPDVVSTYFARESLPKLWRMSYQYGYFKPLVAKKVGGIFTFRQTVPSLFLLSLFAGSVLAPWSAGVRLALLFLASAYIAAVAGCSAAASIQRKAGCATALCLAFPVLHFGYGLGYLKGTVDLFVPGPAKRADSESIPISR